MADTTTVIGRSKLVHADLGYTGGSALHTLQSNLFENLSDNLNSRYKEFAGILDSTTVELDHNFGVAFEELSISIFTGSGTNLTKVSSPLANGWTLNAKVGSLKTILEITTPSSGGPHTFAVQCVVGGSGSGGLAITEIDHTFASDLETGKHYIVDLSGLTTADLSLNLPAGLAGSQIKVSVVGTENQTNYLTTPYYLKLIPDGTEKIYYDGTQYDDILVGKVSPWIQINWNSAFDWVVEDPSNFTSRTLSGNWVIDGIVGKTTGVEAATGNIGERVISYKYSSITQNIPSSEWTNIKDQAGNDGTLVLGKGFWIVKASFDYGGNISSSDSSIKVFGVSENSGDPTDLVLGDNLIHGTHPTSAQEGACTFTFFRNYSSNKTLYPKIKLGTAASTAVIRYNVTAVRLFN